MLGLRAILLVFQLQSERHPAPAELPHLPWPPEVGEVLRFEVRNAGLRDWALDREHHPLPAALIEKDFAAASPDTGCMLNPAAMARHGGGTLTLRSHEATGYWRADWSGSSTMPRLGELGAEPGSDDTPEQRSVEQAILDAADCGSFAQLELGAPVLHALTNVVLGLPPPPPDPAVPRRELHINVQQPPAR